jgi:hypothetical protein
MPTPQTLIFGVNNKCKYTLEGEIGVAQYCARRPTNTFFQRQRHSRFPHPPQDLSKWQLSLLSRRTFPSSAKKLNSSASGILRSEFCHWIWESSVDVMNVQCRGEGYLPHGLHSSPPCRLSPSHGWSLRQKAVQEGADAHRRAIG